MGSEARGVADVAHVAHEEIALRVAAVEFGLDEAVMDVAFGEAVADEDQSLSFCGAATVCARLVAAASGTGMIAWGAFCGAEFMVWAKAAMGSPANAARAMRRVFMARWVRLRD